MITIVFLVFIVSEYAQGCTVLTTCAAYQSSLASNQTVACNDNSTPGYYWSVNPTQIGPYGFYAFMPSGIQPLCNAATLASTAETYFWILDTNAYRVMSAWCRGIGDCGGFGCPMTCPGQQGPTFSCTPTSTNKCGLYSVTCAAIPNSNCSGTISPATGGYSGMYTVTIEAGRTIGNGSDITSVTFCSQEVAAIVSQTTSSVVVQAPALGQVAQCDVVARSASGFIMTLQQAFQYTAPVCTTTATCSSYLTTNPQSIVCNQNTDAAFYWAVNSTSIGPYGYYGFANSGVQPPCNAGTVGTTGQTSFWYQQQTGNHVYTAVCRGLACEQTSSCTPGYCPGQNGPTFSCPNTGAKCGAYQATCTRIANATGTCGLTVSPLTSYSIGGNLVTISSLTNAPLGSGSDVTLVTVAGGNVTVYSQTATSVVIVAPYSASTTTNTIQIWSTSRGIFTLAQGLAYQPLPTGVTCLAATGNCYRYVSSQVPFTTALQNAATYTLGTVQGHLVTIGSAAENSFVVSLLPAVTSCWWIAASDAAAEGVWRWVAGPSDGQQFWQGGVSGTCMNGAFCNWRSGAEPSNAYGSYVENYGAICNAPGVSMLWNDMANNPSSIGAPSSIIPSGYVVELEMSYLYATPSSSVSPAVAGGIAGGLVAAAVLITVIIILVWRRQRTTDTSVAKKDITLSKQTANVPSTAVFAQTQSPPPPVYAYPAVVEAPIPPPSLSIPPPGVETYPPPYSKPSPAQPYAQSYPSVVYPDAAVRYPDSPQYLPTPGGGGFVDPHLPLEMPATQHQK